MENPGLFDETSNYLRGSIDRHERSMRSPVNKKGAKHLKRGTQEIGNKHIDIHIGETDLDIEDNDGEVRVRMPEMDSEERDRSPGDKNALKIAKKPDAEKDGKNLGLFEKSPSSTFKDL